MEQREIKFRAFWPGVNEMKYFVPGNFEDTPRGWAMTFVQPEEGASIFIGKAEIMQYAGLKDKNGKEIYEGDEIEYRVPYRTTQTHTGDNIPNGSYTEPMEPGIKVKGGTVIFKDGMFQIEGDEDETFGDAYPLAWAITEWDLNGIEEAISYSKPGASIFDDPEEGDLQYLINDVAKVKDAEELIAYLSGAEIIGNIYQDPS